MGLATAYYMPPQQQIQAAPQTGGGMPAPNTTMTPTGTAPASINPVAQPYGLSGAEFALNAGQTNALGAVTGGANTATNELNSINGIAAPLEQYGSLGLGAATQMAGLTGTGTPEQNAAAEAAYKSSPGYQYVLDQTLKGTERSAGARGGLLSGNVALELQKNAKGLASTDYQNQFNNLNTVASSGLGATSAAASLKADAKAKLAQLAESIGLNIGSLYTGTADKKAGLRYQAGQDISLNTKAASSSIAQYLNDQGIQVSNAIGKDLSSITDMIYQSGMGDKIDNQNLAALLANINGGQATNVLQGQQSIGAAQAAGTMGVNNALQGGVSNAFATGLLGK
jgi:hypothetical protein